MSQMREVLARNSLYPSRVISILRIGAHTRTNARKMRRRGFPKKVFTYAGNK